MSEDEVSERGLNDLDKPHIYGYNVHTISQVCGVLSFASQVSSMKRIWQKRVSSFDDASNSQRW